MSIAQIAAAFFASGAKRFRAHHEHLRASLQRFYRLKTGDESSNALVGDRSSVVAKQWDACVVVDDRDLARFDFNEAALTKEQFADNDQNDRRHQEGGNAEFRKLR
ncbi:MAG: hypothetical protein AAF449_09815 [Myxococcota bacterium]